MLAGDRCWPNFPDAFTFFLNEMQMILHHQLASCHTNKQQV